MSLHLIKSLRYKAIRFGLLVSLVMPVALVQAEALPGSATTGKEASAATLFHEYCSVCHGDSGQSAMWAQSGLNPKPVDFTSEAARKELDKERMITSVTYGRAETAMVGWGNRLSGAQIEAIVSYIRKEFMKIETEEVTQEFGVDGKHFEPVDMAQPFDIGIVPNVNRGAALYMVNCATCHGPYGDGRGPRAYFINPKPRNFTHTEAQAKFNRPFLFKAISDGRLRAEMPAWSKVWSEQEIADVAEFVFRAYIRKGQNDQYEKFQEVPK